jgi:vanillate O-demethylase ferredoxin subunit
MMAMVATLEAAGSRWRMHYCTRTPDRTAFLDRLAPLIDAGKVLLHHDGGDPSTGLDLAAAVRETAPDRHLYYCGPAGFMAAVAASSGHWPRANVHCEYFSAPLEAAPEGRDNRPFQVKVNSTGEVLEIPPHRSIVAVLRDNGYYVDTSCEDGYCGTCLTPYLEGEPEHRDTVLDDDDRSRYVLICCARSKSPLLVLDL